MSDTTDKPEELPDVPIKVPHGPHVLIVVMPPVHTGGEPRVAVTSPGLNGFDALWAISKATAAIAKALEHAQRSGQTVEPVERSRVLRIN